MIVDDVEARRLARAILEDVILYGGAGALDDARAMAEARDLFASRVSGSLADVFEQERRARGGRDGAGPPGSSGVPAPTGVTVEEGAGLGPVVVVSVAFAIVVAAGALAFFLAAR